jgi:hypothetical protein
MTVHLVCPDCHAYMPVAAERDDFSGEWWPISNDVPKHGCEGVKL